MTTGPRSQCDACRHFGEYPTSLDAFVDGTPAACAAFPDGIPDAVFDNEVDHRQPVDGDHGIRFEARDGDEFPEYAFEMVQRVLRERPDPGTA